MGTAASARVFATGSAWRLTGRAAAGRNLVVAVNHGSEGAQAIAATFLTRAGERAVPLIREGLAGDAPSPMLVDILASIGTQTARRELHKVVVSGTQTLAAAAQHALATLDEIERTQGG